MGTCLLTDVFLRLCSNLFIPWWTPKMVNSRWSLVGRNTLLGTCAWGCIYSLSVFASFSFPFILEKYIPDNSHVNTFIFNYLLSFKLSNTYSVFLPPHAPSSMLFCLTVGPAITTDYELKQHFLCFMSQWCSLTGMTLTFLLPKCILLTVPWSLFLCCVHWWSASHHQSVVSHLRSFPCTICLHLSVIFTNVFVYLQTKSMRTACGYLCSSLYPGYLVDLSSLKNILG